MPAVAAFGIYVLVTALLFRDLLPYLGTHLYSDLGDPLLNAAILFWNAHHLPLTTEWWNFPSFAPLSGVTAFTEHLLATYPLATPIIWATGNALLAHNLVLLAAFPLNGIAAYFLARQLTGSKDAAFIGGLAFAFAQYHSVHLSHIQSLWAFGMPLSLLGLHRYIDGNLEPGTRTGNPEPGTRNRALALFGAGWLLTGLANAYTLVFFPVLVALWSVWFIHPREWRRVIPILIAGALFTLPLVPLLWGYELRQIAYGFVRGIGEMKDFAADIVALIGVSQREQLWRWLLPHTFEESALFPGLTIAVLAVVALVAQVRGQRSKVQGTKGTWSRRLSWLAASLTVIVLARLWTGTFGWHLGPIPLPPFTPFRVFTIAVVAALASLALTPTLHEAWRRRDPVIFYAVAVLAFWLLAIGPQPEWSASHFRALTYGPYYVLKGLPGFSSIRVPARAWLEATLALSVLAAFGTTRLTGRGRYVIAIVAVAIVAEGWFVDKVVPAPLPMDAGVIPANAMALDLPIDEGFWNTIPEYQAVLGGYRSINGYSGYEPPHFEPLRHRIADGYVDALNPFRALGDIYVIIHARELPARAQWVLDHPGARVVHQTRELRVVLLPAMTPPPHPPVPIPLPRRGARPFGM